MRRSNTSRAEKERRLEELKYIGTQYALAGVEPPEEVGQEYVRLRMEMAELDQQEAPRSEERPQD